MSVDLNSQPELAPEMEQWLTANNVDDESRLMWRKYYPIAWNKPSPHVDSPMIHTPHALMLHAHGEEAAAKSAVRMEELQTRVDGRKRRAAQSEQGEEWVKWHQLCRERKQRIADKKKAWHERISYVAEQKRQMSAWVDQARAELYAEQATPVPPAPGSVKVAQ